VALPHHEMGAWAVDTLVRRIEDPTAEPEQLQLRCPLVPRASVAPPAD
jgi:LacI family transcriptional regulator